MFSFTLHIVIRTFRAQDDDVADSIRTSQLQNATNLLHSFIRIGFVLIIDFHGRFGTANHTP